MQCLGPDRFPRLRCAVLCLAFAGTLPARAADTIVFSEIMYHPRDIDGPEWLELYNPMAVDVDLGGWQLRGGVTLDLPPDTVIPAGDFLLVSADPTAMQAACGCTGVLGPWVGNLSNGGESIRLVNNAGRIMDAVRYDDSGEWPVGADGSGASLTRLSDGGRSDDPANWRASTAIGGTPGTATFSGNAPTMDPADASLPGPLAFHELAATGDSPFRIELKNIGLTSVDTTGFVVRATGLQGGSCLVPGVHLEPESLLVIDETSLGFRAEEGERLFLYAPGEHTLLDAAAIHAWAQARATEHGIHFLVPSASTFGEPNTFDLHTNIVINEIMYHFRDDPAGNGLPPIENDEEWVELLNAGAVPEDLSAWRLSGGVSFVFPAGTVLAPGALLVVTRDAAALRAKYPDRAQRILGNMAGRLANANDRVCLLDAAGNPADDVRYFDGGRWPGLADGHGSSLELRDARGDNALPDAWAPSDETEKTAWQPVTYRMTAQQAFGPTTWNEFRLGLLAAGEVWVDDLRVIRDPDGAAQPVIQNGDFETSPGDTAWRFLGNHRHSGVIEEPAGGGNHVLRIVADGGTDTRHNHLETTLAGNAPLQDGHTYEVSLRARWVAGENRLLASAYYAKLAQGIELAVPDLCGTPGMTNSCHVVNAGPCFRGLRHAPAMPDAGEAVTVTTFAQDPDGVAEAFVHMTANGLPAGTVAMTPEPGGRYTAVLPGREAGAIVQFWVSATDNRGAVATCPAGGSASRALYQVNDGRRTDLPIHELQLVMLPADRDFMLAALNLMSNERLGGTVIYNGTDVFYDVGVRLRGSGAGRARDGAAYQSYNIAFPADQPFRGIHDSIGIDRSGRTPTVRGQDELYVKHMFNRAGLPCTFDDLVYFIPPATEHTGSALLVMGGYDRPFVDTQFPDDRDGSVFNLDITYDPVSTTDGNPESLKPPVPFLHVGTDFTDLGTDKEQYRGPFELVTGGRRDDYDGLIAFCRTMALPNAQLAAAIGTVMDVDEWMRYAALSSLCGIGDCYANGGLPHNIRVYVPQGSGRTVALPHDMDFVFYENTTAPILLASGNLRRVIDLPANTRLFWGHLKHLAEHIFTPTYMDRWLAHYSAVAGQDFAAQSTYIAARSSYALSQLPAPVPFAVTTGFRGRLTVTGLTAIVEGNGWIDIREFRIAGREGSPTTEWTSTDTWRMAIPVAPGQNPLTLEAHGFDGELLAACPLVITSTSGAPRPVDHLRVTEIHYNPLDSDDYEFVELQNSGALTLPLQGVRLAEAVDFTFGNRFLEPGAYLVVVEDATAFSNRYLNAASPYCRGAIDVAGEWSGSLNDDGETLRLLDATDVLIEEIAYRNGGAWPGRADGRGASLQRARPEFPPSCTEHWRASSLYHGSPGWDDSISPVVINELMTHSDTGTDWIELLNTGTQSVDITGWFLSDSLDDPLKYAIPPRPPMTPGAFAVFDQQAFDVGPTAFSFSELGDEAVVTEAAGTNIIRVIAYEDFSAAARDVPFGRWRLSDGTAVLTALAAATPGSSNAAPVVGPVVISEIMYHPVTGGLEYVELLNITDATVPLYDPDHPSNAWKLASAAAYTFPPGCELPGRGRLVVAPSDADTFRGVYGVAPYVPVYGPWDGALDNAGESVRLRRPGSPEPDGSVPYIVADRVDYRPYAPWPPAADGQGPSLERLNCRAFGNDARNWWAAPGSYGTPGTLFDPMQLNIDSPGGLSWSAASGEVYRVEYRDNLADGAWNLLEERLAATPRETILDPAAVSQPRRFYRILWLR